MAQSSQNQEQIPFFAEAMQGVIPLTNRTNRDRVSIRALSSSLPHSIKTPTSQLKTHFSISQEGEKVWGKAPHVNQKTLASLQKGTQLIQKRLDLHHLSTIQAKKQLLSFVLSSYEQGLRFLLLIHGKGIHSRSSSPILKREILSWLEESPISSLLLAFCSATPMHGGTGALYLQLRKKK